MSTDGAPSISVNNQLSQVWYVLPLNRLQVSQNNSNDANSDMPSVIYQENENKKSSHLILIPTGSILLTHSPVYIPIGGAVEVLHSPKLPKSTTNQQNASVEQFAGSNQHNMSCCLHKSNVAKNCAQIGPRNQSTFGLPQQEKTPSTNVNLLQQILLNNCAIVENSTDVQTLDKCVSDTAICRH